MTAPRGHHGTTGPRARAPHVLMETMESWGRLLAGGSLDSGGEARAAFTQPERATARAAAPRRPPPQLPAPRRRPHTPLTLLHKRTL
ncbi:hypothetical protein EVAR_22611_1 [Eumeta japonica]|uniref:Uncharacterized protein n=1 Tax=Eumeta variegata TaxID=151549 RepID=A0A4C1U7I0_EUMVA|nr:hypothetical protein EVAR_22611_1 [Eumeta japonica]